MKRRTFLGAIGALVGLLFPKWSNTVNVDIANTDTGADNPLSVLRDHSLDTFPIIYNANKRPPNIVSVSRLLCRIQKGSIYDRWFYHHARPGIYYPGNAPNHGVYYPAFDLRNARKYFQYLNGCNHSYFYFSPQFGEKSIDDAVCSRIESGGFLNSWTVSDWSFLQGDGTWRNWDTFIDGDTGKHNGFSPADLTKFPYNPFCVWKVCFLSRYEFIILLLENGDKTDKIRMNGYCGKGGDWSHGMRHPYHYERFADREYIPANQYLSTEYFVADMRACGVDLIGLSGMSSNFGVLFGE